MGQFPAKPWHSGLNVRLSYCAAATTRRIDTAPGTVTVERVRAMLSKKCNCVAVRLQFGAARGRVVNDGIAWIYPGAGACAFSGVACGHGLGHGFTLKAIIYKKLACVGVFRQYGAGDGVAGFAVLVLACGGFEFAIQCAQHLPGRGADV